MLNTDHLLCDCCADELTIEETARGICASCELDDQEIREDKFLSWYGDGGYVNVDKDSDDFRWQSPD